METTYVTKYPSLVEQSAKQGLDPKDVFFKSEQMEDGKVKLSYPRTDLDMNGKIPVDSEGTVVDDAGKLKAAKMLSSLHGEDQALKAKIAASSTDVSESATTDDADDASQIM